MVRRKGPAGNGHSQGTVRTAPSQRPDKFIANFVHFFDPVHSSTPVGPSQNLLKFIEYLDHALTRWRRLQVGQRFGSGWELEDGVTALVPKKEIHSARGHKFGSSDAFRLF